MWRSDTPSVRALRVAQEPTATPPPKPYADLTVGVVKETGKLEDRVAQSPQSVGSLVKAGFKVVVEGFKVSVEGFNVLVEGFKVLVG